MVPFLQKYTPALILFLLTLLGVTLGAMFSTVGGIYLSPTIAADSKPIPTQKLASQRATLKDYAIINSENIFNSSAQKSVSSPTFAKTSANSTAEPGKRGDLRLLGTVVADGNSQALIESGKTIEIYHLGDALAGGGNIETIDRNTVVILFSDGSRQTLTLYEENIPQRINPASPPPSSTDKGITDLGDNRWAIDPMVANNARENIGELLKSTRMEPRIVNGATSGFAVKMIRPQSLLAKMGIRRGDVIMQINDVTLDSPEKALQIFQLLREARKISVSLERNGTPDTFQYEIN